MNEEQKEKLNGRRRKHEREKWEINITRIILISY
jgi:hypothetical protein